MRTFQRTMLTALSLGVLGTMAVTAKTASAAPITYIYSGVGSGSYSGDVFNDLAFTITGTADTANTTTVSVDSFPAVALTTMSIQLAGFTTAIPTIPMFMVNASNLSPDILAFSGVTTLTSFQSFTVPGSATWDLVSDFPDTSAGFVNNNPIPTNEGAVTFTSTSSATFQAITGTTVTPEPGTLALLTLGGVGVAALRRRKA